MRDTGISIVNYTDGEGNPSGGKVEGTGLGIDWQCGCVRPEIGWDPSLGEAGNNGALLEDVLEACQVRLEFLDHSKFECSENKEAIMHVKRARECLEERTRNRKQRGVEGTYKV